MHTDFFLAPLGSDGSLESLSGTSIIRDIEDSLLLYNVPMSYLKEHIMNANQRKEELGARVQLAIKGGAKDITSKGNHQKQKTCSVCGEGFLGREGASSCGDKCRKSKQR